MISEVYAMASPQPGSGQSSPGIGQMLLPMAVIFLIFYFLLLRPQKKKEIAHRKFLEGLKKGDEVVTQAGLLGRIANISDNVVTLEVADKVKIRVTKNTIAGLQTPPATPS